MPEDYQSLIAELGGTTDQGSQEPVATTEPEVSTEEPKDAVEEPVTTDPAPAEPEETEQDPKATEADAKRNEAFAAMRTQNAKYRQFVQQLMKGANYQGDEAAFIDQLTDASYNQMAKNQGNQVSPELLKRMDTMEAQNKALLEERNRQAFTTNLANLQDTFKLSNAEVKEFVQLAVDEHIDLTIPGTNFVTLYQGLFFDKILNKKVEEERQNWIAQSAKADNAANPDGKSGKKDPAPTNVNTMAEFESLLQSIPKK